MDKEHTAITNPDVACCSCLGEAEEISHINIKAIGWGSRFDLGSTQLNLCHDCRKQISEEWLKLEVVEQEKSMGRKYKYEDEIIQLVETFPLAGQELFYNRYNSKYSINPQTWINNELGNGGGDTY